MQLRHSLIPYIYTMAWKNHTESIPLMTPMYYYHSDEERAYEFKDQYYFGSELLVSPFITRRDKATNLSRKSTWLPKGEWFNFFNGEYHCGEKVAASYGKLEDIPVFAKAGAIVPLNPNVMEHTEENPKELDLYVFPGNDNKFSLYEDDGETMDYAKGESAVTTFIQEWSTNSMEFIITPVAGNKSCIPSERTYGINFRGVKRPDKVEVLINGTAEAVDFRYDADNHTLIIGKIAVAPSDELTVKISVNEVELINKDNNVVNRCIEMLKIFNMKNDTKGWIYYYMNKILEDLSILTTLPDVESSQWIALAETIKGEEILSKIH
jgi:hypothetical protein